MSRNERPRPRRPRCVKAERACLACSTGQLRASRAFIEGLSRRALRGQFRPIQFAKVIVPLLTQSCGFGTSLTLIGGTDVRRLSALGELAAATVFIASGLGEAPSSREEEPGEDRWIFQSVDDSTELAVLWFDVVEKLGELGYL